MTVAQNEATLSKKNAGLGQAHPQKQLAVKVLIVESPVLLDHIPSIFLRG